MLVREKHKSKPIKSPINSYQRNIDCGTVRYYSEAVLMTPRGRVWRLNEAMTGRPMKMLLPIATYGIKSIFSTFYQIG
jgi:hypothetical protein